MKNLNNILFVLLVSGMISCGSQRELPTVDQLDIDKYLGTWYEIVRLPNPFEKGLKCITANYSLKDNGKIQVLNKGYSIKKEKFTDAKGTAWRPDPEEPGELKVRFFWPFAGDYFVIELAEDYSHVLVGDPSRKYLWILARETSIDKEIYDKLVEKAKSLGFDTSQLITVTHDCQ